MEIKLKEITIRELTEGYQDNAEGGVRGYGGLLDIRPPYQREFVYNEKQRDAVIDTVMKKFPLNVMYWAVRDDGTYEVIDGQQRTISICQYVAGDFSYSKTGYAFYNLLEHEQKELLDYRLMVYLCSGTAREKLDWFETINIAGAELTKQELRNAVFSGPWVSDAKRYFSRNNCPAKGLASGYVSGSPIRQDYLETAIRWIANARTDEEIRKYMSDHHGDANALALWTYFQSVITWVQGTFVKKREKFMKSVNWGELYNAYKDQVYDTAQLEEKTVHLMMDDDVTNKSGIYPYLLTGDERTLSIRTFTPAMAYAAYERQQGICPRCGRHFEFEAMEADHITPWHAGGRTVADNCQMLCRDCNRRKSGK